VRDIHHQDLSFDKFFERILKKTRVSKFIRATKEDEGKVHPADIRLCSKDRMADRSAFILQVERSYICLVTRIAKGVLAEKKYLD